MKLFYFQYSPRRFPGGLTNFGDQLNPWIWQQLIPDLLDQDERTAFVGIGTLLNSLLPKRLPNAQRIVIFSTGLGYEQLPTVEPSWRIYCLRGPLTAQRLGFPELAVTDGGALVRRLFQATEPKRHLFALMPHAKSARYASSAWASVCQQINFGYIDPRSPVDSVLAAISQTEVLLTEAMHGAVVADALRVPWIPIVTNPNILAFKWQDWCKSLELEYQPQYVMPWVYPTPQGIRSSLRYSGYWLNWLRQDCGRSLLQGKQHVATQLIHIARTRPYLSRESRLEHLTMELEAKLEQFRLDVESGAYS